MRFLKEHSFILAVVGAVVVLGGITLALDFSAGGDLDELVEKRANLSRDLKSLTNKPRVNDAVLAAEKDRVRRSKGAAQVAIDRSVEWNRGDFKVMKLTYGDGTGASRTIPAFPIQRDEYNDFGLVYVLTGQYLKELESMLAGLNPTEAPSPQEIQDEQDRVARKLAALKAAEERKKGIVSPGATIRRSRARPRKMMKMDPMMMKMDPKMMKGPMMMMKGPMMGRGRRSAASLTSEAEQKGLESIRLKKARMGELYAEIDAFQPVFASPQVKATDTELWQAQMHLWVVKEIVGAIQQTNHDRLSTLPQGQRNVLNAPVKRLVSLQVERAYYASSGSSSAGTARPGMMMKGTMRKMDLMMMKGPGPGMFGKGPMPGMGRPRTGARTAAGSISSDLTSRACNPLYDVIHYQFTVIMPRRYLQDLELNLLKRNNHTVLNMSTSQVAPDIAGRSSRAGIETLYYYGTDPVEEVTLAGELLLMTAWERGTYDSTAKQWSRDFPPLMPKEVLANLKSLVPSSMRQEDDMRLAER